MEEILVNIKAEMLNQEKFEIKSLYLFGSYTRGNNLVSSDIDLVAVVNNDIILTDFINSVSPILVKYSKENRIYFSCFPVKESDFDGSNSQFIKNVKKSGKVI